MIDYELTVVLKPTLTEKELDKEVKYFTDLVEKIGAKITKKVDPAKRNLAYAIQKFKEAYYLYFELTMKPAEVSAVEQKIKLQENFLRYLIVKKDVK